MIPVTMMKSDDVSASADQDQQMTGASVGRLWHYPVKSM
jgi:hypothetical protein